MVKGGHDVQMISLKFGDCFLREPRSKKQFVEDYLDDKIQTAAIIFLQEESRCYLSEDISHDLLFNMPSTSKPDDFVISSHNPKEKKLAQKLLQKIATESWDSSDLNIYEMF